MQEGPANKRLELYLVGISEGSSSRDLSDHGQPLLFGLLLWKPYEKRAPGGRPLKGLLKIKWITAGSRAVQVDYLDYG